MASDENQQPAPSKDAHALEAEAALRRALALRETPGPLHERVRAQALSALRELRAALGPALAEKPAEARRVGQFAEVAAAEAVHAEPSGSLISTALSGLDQAVERLEPRCPILVGLAEKVGEALGKIGI